MKGSQPQVLRLNLGYSDEPPTPFYSATSSPAFDSGESQSFRMKHSTPISSPEYPSSSFSRTTGDTSLSTFDTPSSPFLMYDQNPLFERPNKGKETPVFCPVNSLEYDKGRLISTSRSNRYDSFCDSEFQNHNKRPPVPINSRSSHESRSPASKLVVDNLFRQECEAKSGILGEVNKSSVRDSISISRASSAPPPLCSICQHKTPTFGKPPRRFTFDELDSATNGFSDSNLLAEGGFGIVHRGVLTDGQVVAVKQLKFVDSQADVDFCREVRVLSCAQHRNVVLLIGFCLEGQHRVLVYEFICNSSLDFHLHSKHSGSLDPHLRLKIALGIARGLRYLHEDCRVGCIVHRDMRPNNILLTHNFEPLVGDFGLARLHSEWNMGIDQQVIGASGYIAPEYFDGGSITEKVDVYAFGVILMELITGKRIKELQQDKELSSMTQIFDPLDTLQGNLNLKPGFSSKDAQGMPYEIEVMGHAACLCLRRNPETRPSMSKVLRILEEGGNTPMPIGMDLRSVGSQSGHLQGLRPRRYSELRKCHSRKLSQ